MLNELFYESFLFIAHILSPIFRTRTARQVLPYDQKVHSRCQLSVGRLSTDIIDHTLKSALLACATCLKTAGFIDPLEEKTVPKYVYS